MADKIDFKLIKQNLEKANSPANQAPTYEFVEVEGNYFLNISIPIDAVTHNINHSPDEYRAAKLKYIKTTDNYNYSLNPNAKIKSSGTTDDTTVLLSLLLELEEDVIKKPSDGGW